MADILSGAIDTTFDALGEMPLARKLEGALGGRGAVKEYVGEEVAELGPALSRGFGAFGARIAGGEQGFIAYMNNLAQKDAKAEDRAFQEKQVSRAESFRREMLEMEHGHKLDAQGRDHLARQELQTQIDTAAIDRAGLEVDAKKQAAFTLFQRTKTTATTNFERQKELEDDRHTNAVALQEMKQDHEKLLEGLVDEKDLKNKRAFIQDRLIHMLGDKKLQRGVIQTVADANVPEFFLGLAPKEQRKHSYEHWMAQDRSEVIEKYMATLADNAGSLSARSQFLVADTLKQSEQMDKDRVFITSYEDANGNLGFFGPEFDNKTTKDISDVNLADMRVHAEQSGKYLNLQQVVSKGKRVTSRLQSVTELNQMPSAELEDHYDSIDALIDNLAQEARAAGAGTVKAGQSIGEDIQKLGDYQGLIDGALQNKYDTEAVNATDWLDEKHPIHTHPARTQDALPNMRKRLEATLRQNGEDVRKKWQAIGLLMSGTEDDKKAFAALMEGNEDLKEIVDTIGTLEEEGITSLDGILDSVIEELQNARPGSKRSALFNSLNTFVQKLDNPRIATGLDAGMNRERQVIQKDRGLENSIIAIKENAVGIQAILNRNPATALNIAIPIPADFLTKDDLVWDDTLKKYIPNPTAGTKFRDYAIKAIRHGVENDPNGVDMADVKKALEAEAKEKNNPFLHSVANELWKAHKDTQPTASVPHPNAVNGHSVEKATQESYDALVGLSVNTSANRNIIYQDNFQLMDGLQHHIKAASGNEDLAALLDDSPQLNEDAWKMLAPMMAQKRFQYPQKWNGYKFVSVISQDKLKDEPAFKELHNFAKWNIIREKILGIDFEDADNIDQATLAGLVSIQQHFHNVPIEDSVGLANEWFLNLVNGDENHATTRLTTRKHEGTAFTSAAITINWEGPKQIRGQEIFDIDPPARGAPEGTRGERYTVAKEFNPKVTIEPAAGIPVTRTLTRDQLLPGNFVTEDQMKEMQIDLGEDADRLKILEGLLQQGENKSGWRRQRFPKELGISAEEFTKQYPKIWEDNKLDSGDLVAIKSDLERKKRDHVEAAETHAAGKVFREIDDSYNMYILSGGAPSEEEGKGELKVKLFGDFAGATEFLINADLTKQTFEGSVLEVPQAGIASSTVAVRFATGDHLNITREMEKKGLDEQLNIGPIEGYLEGKRQLLTRAYVTHGVTAAVTKSQTSAMTKAYKDTILGEATVIRRLAKDQGFLSRERDSIEANIRGYLDPKYDEWRQGTKQDQERAALNFYLAATRVLRQREQFRGGNPLNIYKGPEEMKKEEQERAAQSPIPEPTEIPAQAETEPAVGPIQTPEEEKEQAANLKAQAKSKARQSGLQQSIKNLERKMIYDKGTGKTRPETPNEVEARLKAEAAKEKKELEELRKQFRKAKGK